MLVAGSKPRRGWLAVGSMLLGLMGGLGVALAQDKTGDAPKDIAEKALPAADPAAPERVDGWKSKLWLGGSLTFNHSNNVVGTADGSNVQIGLLLDGSALMIRGQHEWETVLKVQHSQSRTTVIDSFVKSADNFDLKTTYFYRLNQPAWLGPYARVAVTTALFKGFEVRAEDTDVVRFYTDGSEEDELVLAGDHIELTGSFEPLVLSENFGVFAAPVERKDLTVKLKLGLGAQHILTRDGFAVDDNKDTAELELKQLRKSTEAGGVLDLNLAGQLAENVTWKADTGLFLEFVSSSEEDVGPLNLDFAGSLSVKLAKWASLDYVLNVKRVPRILDEWQVANGVVLTTGFNLF